MFSHNDGNNIYYSTTIGAGAYADGETIEYYLQIPYSDHDTTFVHGSDGPDTAAQEIAFFFAGVEICLRTR